MCIIVVSLLCEECVSWYECGVLGLRRSVYNTYLLYVCEECAYQYAWMVYDYVGICL